MNSAPGEKEPGQPTANIGPLRRFVHRMSLAWRSVGAAGAAPRGMRHERTRLRLVYREDR